MVEEIDLLVLVEVVLAVVAVMLVKEFLYSTPILS